MLGYLPMFAVVEVDKKQYIVKKGDVLDVQKIKKGSKKITFDKVLLLADKGKASVGTPYLKPVKVEAEIQGQKRGKKVIVYKYKKRKKYRKKQGHRQDYTTIKITGILTGSEKKKKDTAAKPAKKPPAAKPAKKKTASKKPASKKSTAKK